MNRRRRKKGDDSRYEEARRLVVGEEHRKTMTDIVTGKSQYQNWWKKTQSFRTHLDNETEN